MLLRRGRFISFMACLLIAVPAVLSSQTPTPQEQEKLKQADAAFHAGYAAMQSGELEQARAQFMIAASLAPEIPEGHQALGTVLVSLGKFSEAIAEFETALKLKPGDEAIESNLADAYLRSGNPAKALPFFAAAFQASQQAGNQPVDTDFCQSYARALAANGKLEEAIQMFEQAAKRGGASAEVWDSIGSLHAQLSNWAEARANFELALTFDSKFLPARIHLGIVQRQQNDIPASIASLDAAVAAAPGNAVAQFEYGRTLEAAGQDEAATTHLEQAVKLDPNLPGVQNELAMVLQRQGRQQDAIPWFQQAIQRDPQNASALINLGLALTLTGKAKEALDYFQRAQADAPPDATFYKDRGVAHVQLSAFDEAIADFNAALKLDSNDPQLHYDLGMAYKFKDRVDDAIAELTRAGQWIPPFRTRPILWAFFTCRSASWTMRLSSLKKPRHCVLTAEMCGPSWAARSSRTRG